MLLCFSKTEVTVVWRRHEGKSCSCFSCRPGGECRRIHALLYSCFSDQSFQSVKRGVGKRQILGVCQAAPLLGFRSLEAKQRSSHSLLPACSSDWHPRALHRCLSPLGNERTGAAAVSHTFHRLRSLVCLA